jgi:hypothetical protein
LPLGVLFGEENRQAITPTAANRIAATTVPVRRRLRLAGRRAAPGDGAGRRAVPGDGTGRRAVPDDGTGRRAVPDDDAGRRDLVSLLWFP